MRLTRDQTFNVVFNLRTPSTAQPGSEDVGTGMFISKSDNELFMLTASHVAKASTSSTNVVLIDATGNSTSVNITLFNSALSWIHHPIADISALPVTVNSSNVQFLKERFFPYSQLNTSGPTPSRDAYLTSVGFPNGLGASGKFSPLTFRSHASSSVISLNRADTNTPSDFFILEDPSIGGYSGGPIFDLGYIIVGAMTTNTGDTICHGIMHGTISDNTGGKLAAVTPCTYVKDII